MTNLTDKVVLVTGASRGIGCGIAKVLAASGAHVIGTATSQSGADLITQNLSKYNGEGKVLDVCSDESVSGLLSDMKASTGMPDVLVNNAGITNDKLLIRMGSEDWLRVLDTNLSSVYRMSKACLRSMMKKRFGRIITIGSVIGAVGNPGQCNYAAAKAGLIGFSKSMAREVGSRGITVNVVAPGYIETDMTNQLDEVHAQKLQEQIPLGRMGEVNDVANAVLFLASDMANYITGETLHINGGMYMG